jgi:hypothetical protein
MFCPSEVFCSKLLLYCFTNKISLFIAVTIGFSTQESHVFCGAPDNRKSPLLTAKNLVAVSECNNLTTLLQIAERVCTNTVYEERLLELSSVTAYGSDGLDSYCT